MKKIFAKFMFVGAIVALMTTACSEPVAEECTREHVPTVVPTLTLETAEATSESISFTLTPTDAASVRYYVAKAMGGGEVTAELLFDKASDYYGTPADAAMADTYTVAGLDLGTEYMVYAAAKNNIGLSELQSLAITTLIPEMTLNAALGEIKANKVSFSFEATNALRVAYIVATEAQTAESIFANGTVCEEADGEHNHSVGGLKPSTDYTLYVAAYNLADGDPQVKSFAFTTLEQPAPQVGDYYYADGSWSSELDVTSNPIGVIFYLGKHETDTTTYTQKDGATPMEEFHGYVVAAYDATYDAATGNNNGVAWGWQTSWTDDANGTSTSTSDFLGYANSKEVLADANGTLTDNNTDNYPAFYYAMVKQDELYAAPAESSGWFLPSAGQLKYIWDTFNPTSAPDAIIDNKLAALAEAQCGAKMYAADAEYWSSTERSGNAESQSMYVVFDSSNWNPGYIDYWNKTYEMRVRAMLAF